MKYKLRTQNIDAIQWWNHGDHPEVHKYENPCVPDWHCNDCRYMADKHGYLLYKQGALLICQGDWIVTNKNGEHFVVKNNMFLQIYEPVGDDNNGN